MFDGKTDGRSDTQWRLGSLEKAELCRVTALGNSTAWRLGQLEKAPMPTLTTSSDR